MRRLTVIAAFVVFAALVSAFAQRGSMRGSGGGRGVAVGRSSGGHGNGGVHSGPRVSPSHSFGGFRGNGFGGARIHNRGFHHCFGCRRGFGYPGYGGYYDPYWWWNSSSSYDYDEDQVREEGLPMR